MVMHESKRKRKAVPTAVTRAMHIARHWDAGDAGCGALIMGLRQQIGRIAPGELLEVTAQDAAAPIDIAAWCHMTGHALAAESHPTYVLQRRDA